MAALRRRLVLAAAGLAAALLVSEIGLRVADVPRFHRAHSAPDQFKFLQDPNTKEYFFVNNPGTRMRFEYDSNPRGYFEDGNVVHHTVNAEGFRGGRLNKLPPRTLRMVFLGDSFTFGEGVRDRDTFAEVASRRLNAHYEEQGVRFQICNLGVSAYNTSESLFLLEIVAAQARPDLVVLCFVLNDAEPALFKIDPVRRVPIRRHRESQIADGVDDARPPDKLIYTSRLAQLVWRALSNKARSRQTITFYRDLYAPTSAGWKNAKNALSNMGKFLGDRGIPFYVMVFPILFELNEAHPFDDLYKLVADHARASGAGVLDLFPAFSGHSGPALWVHPTDQHPNEKAHAIAGEQLVRFLIEDGKFRKTVGNVR